MTNTSIILSHRLPRIVISTFGICIVEQGPFGSLLSYEARSQHKMSSGDHLMAVRNYRVRYDPIWQLDKTWAALYNYIG